MKLPLIALGFTLVVTPSIAAPLTFTGAEIAQLSNVTLAPDTKVVAGTSLFNGASTTFRLAEFPLEEFGSGLSNINIIFNVTRLPTVFDGFVQRYQIRISDGLNIFGTSTSAGLSTTGVRNDDVIRGGVFESEVGSGVSLGTVPLGSGQDLPFNSTFDLDFTIQTRATDSLLSLSFNQAAEFGRSSSRLFDPANGGFSLVLGGLGPSSYQFNSITFNDGLRPSGFLTTQVTEPSSLAGLSIALLSFAGLIRRRRL